MPLFSQMFSESLGRPIFHKNREVSRAISLEAPRRIRLILTFVERNSKYRQGVSFNLFAMKGTLSCNGQTISKGSFALWEDITPRQIVVDAKIEKGSLDIFNIAERSDFRGHSSIVSLNMGMAIYHEEIELNKYRFCCNDWEPDDDFNDLIFDLEIIPLNEEETDKQDSSHVILQYDPDRHVLVLESTDG